MTNLHITCLCFPYDRHAPWFFVLAPSVLCTAWSSLALWRPACLDWLLHCSILHFFLYILRCPTKWRQINSSLWQFTNVWLWISVEQRENKQLNKQHKQINVISTTHGSPKAEFIEGTLQVLLVWFSLRTITHIWCLFKWQYELRGQ